MGYINPSTYPSFGRAVRLYYEERNVNTAANTSDIYWELQGYNRQPDATGYYDAGPFNATINGVKVVNNLYPSGSRIQLREDTVVARGTLANVAHDSDGSKSVTASFSCDYIYDATNKASGSGSIPLTTIPRASTITMTDGVFGQSWTVGISSAVATFTNEVTITIGAHTETRTITGSGTVNISNGTTRSWADAAPTSDSATVTVTCVTKNGGTTIGTTTATATFIVPESWKPNPTVPPTVTGVNTFGGDAIQNVSQAKIQMALTATPGATLTSVRVTGPNINQTVTNPSASQSVTTGTLTTSGTKTWTIITTDSRGRQGTMTSRTLNVTPYQLPTIKLTARRCDSGGTADDLGNYMTATADCSFDTTITNNKAGVTVKMTSSGGTTTTLGTLTNQSAAFSYTTPVTAASSTDTFLVEATITDSVGSSVTISTRLSTAQVLMDFKAGGDGVAFGGSATESNVVAVKNWTLKLDNPLGKAYGGSGMTAVETGTYTPTLAYSDGTTLTYSSATGGYAKWGPVIHYFGYAQITALGSTGNKFLHISGFPYSMTQGLGGAGPRFEMATPPSDNVGLLLHVLTSYVRVERGPQGGYSRATLQTGWCGWDFWAMEA